MKDWPLTQAGKLQLLAINNAWRIRPDWHYLIYPEDFPPENRPPKIETDQQLIIADDYVPVQNRYGGFVYAGGTMAFTAAYWVLGVLKPSVMAFVGCDMVYPKSQQTHFYGTGEADPLRDDITLQSLEAKAMRLQVLAAEQGCTCINLTSLSESRLVYPKVDAVEFLTAQTQYSLAEFEPQAVAAAKQREGELGYFVASGRYWEERQRFSTEALSELDSLWLQTRI